MIIDRILQIVEYKESSKRQFYIKTELSNGFLDKVKDVGASKLEKILNTYPDINPVWLLTGKGEMLISPDGNERSSGSDNVEVLKKEIEHLNEKLKDKEEIIRLMKNQS